MEVLYSATIDGSMPIIVLLLLIGGTFLGSYIFREYSKILNVIISLLVILIWIGVYYSFQNEVYEYKKVIVEDWNVVHSEGWEVVRQEGEIIELKRKLEGKE